MAKLNLSLAILSGLFFLSSSQAAESLSAHVQSIEADEVSVYTNQPKKLDVRVSISPMGSEPQVSKWNLVQVDPDGKLIRYLGVLFFNEKKGFYFRKLELQEREPGKRYFEVVPDSELEPFVVSARPRLMIEVLRRPTLTEILKGVWDKIFSSVAEPEQSNRALAQEAISESSGRRCTEKAESGWSSFKEGEAAPGSKFQKGVLSSGGVFAAVRAEVGFPIGEVVDQLWNPLQIKNPRNTRLKMSEIAVGDGAKTRQVEVNVRPFLFVNLDWRELWSWRELKLGEVFRIEYRKVGGEERLKHFCGWMETRKLSPARTEVVLFEEIDAPHRTPEDVVNGHLGTLQMLERTLKKPQ
ncbi:hypothetical protein EBZ37_06880 [bacterium]|nr:hypothetical protein [bacterium]